MFKTYDHLLSVNASTLAKSNSASLGTTQRLISCMDRLLSSSTDTVHFADGDNLAVMKLFPCNYSTLNAPDDVNSSTAGPVGMQDYGEGGGYNMMGPGGSSTATGENPPASTGGRPMQSSIVIPNPELFCLDESTSVHFVIYRQPKLYLDKSAMDEALASRSRAARCARNYFPSPHRSVLVASIVGGNTSYTHTTPTLMARLLFAKHTSLDPLHATHRVPWWLPAGGWARKNPCELREEEDYFVAECYHLTDFTLLVDGMESDPIVCDMPLAFVGYLFNFGSMLCLLFMSGVFVVNRWGGLFLLNYTKTQFNRIQNPDAPPSPKPSSSPSAPSPAPSSSMTPATG